MLSVEQCRKILGCGGLLSDKELEILRDQMYGLADVILDCLKSRSIAENTSGNFRRALTLIPEDVHPLLEERAAIVEFDGQTIRDDAERFTVLEYLRSQAFEEPSG